MKKLDEIKLGQPVLAVRMHNDKIVYVNADGKNLLARGVIPHKYAIVGVIKLT